MFFPEKNEKQFECVLCNYKCSRKSNLDRHNLSRTHQNSIEKGGKSRAEYNCVSCDYTCSNKYNWNEHILTAKHQKLNNIAPIENITVENEQTHKCIQCNKEYKKYNSLWYHQKRCKGNLHKYANINLSSNDDSIKNAVSVGPSHTVSVPQTIENNNETSTLLLANILKELIEQNKELKQLIVEKNTPTVSNQNNYLITNNGTVNNNKFNLNVFLNEECKDAVNITDYVDSMQLKLEDLEATAQLGYAEGITKIINDRVKEYGVFQRPFHCTDSKREIVYVKDNNVWEKENSDKPRMRKMITNVIHKNLQQLSKWHEKYPECLDTTTNRSDEYLNIMIEANGGQEREKKEDQILKNILKEVFVEK